MSFGWRGPPSFQCAAGFVLMKICASRGQAVCNYRMKHLLPVAGLLAGAYLLAGCSHQSPGKRVSLLAKIKARGYITVGYADEAPFAYIDPKTGKLTGESPTVLRAVMNKLGVRHIHGVLTNFGSLIPALKAGRFDVIAAGMYITPLRCRQIAFSNPTFAIGDGFVVKKGNPLHLHSYTDFLHHPSWRLGVVQGAIEYNYAREVGIPKRQIRLFPDAPSALAAVENGRVNAYAATELTVRRLVRQAHGAGVAVASPFHNPVIKGVRQLGYGSFGFRRSNVRLRRAVDKVLKTYIPSRQHLRAVRRFGFTAADMPGDITADQLCGCKSQAPAKGH